MLLPLPLCRAGKKGERVGKKKEKKQHAIKTAQQKRLNGREGRVWFAGRKGVPVERPWEKKQRLRAQAKYIFSLQNLGLLGKGKGTSREKGKITGPRKGEK